MHLVFLHRFASKIAYENTTVFPRGRKKKKKQILDFWLFHIILLNLKIFFYLTTNFILANKKYAILYRSTKYITISLFPSSVFLSKNGSKEIYISKSLFRIPAFYFLIILFSHIYSQAHDITMSIILYILSIRCVFLFKVK